MLLRVRSLVFWLCVSPTHALLNLGPVVEGGFVLFEKPQVPGENRPVSPNSGLVVKPTGIPYLSSFAVSQVRNRLQLRCFPGEKPASGACGVLWLYRPQPTAVHPILLR